MLECERITKGLSHRSNSNNKGFVARAKTATYVRKYVLCAYVIIRHVWVMDEERVSKLENFQACEPTCPETIKTSPQMFIVVGLLYIRMYVLTRYIYMYVYIHVYIYVRTYIYIRTYA